MDLHDLFSTAVADLPELPDQVPAAQRIHRRRTATTRAGAVAAAAALVVGVGTLTITSPWSSRPPATSVRVASPASSAVTPTSASYTALGSIKEVRPDKRSDAPSLSGVTLSGTALSTSHASYAGHVTVLDLWGSWCTPCREEAPTMAQAYQAHQSEGVQFLGIDVRDDNAAAEAYQTAFGIGYPSLRDPDGALVLRLRPFVPASTLPSLVIVDSHGKVAVIVTGIITSTQLDEQISYALATPTS